MNTFIISDTHFGHANALTFLRADGNPLRPFKSVEDMDETIVQNWNSIVRPKDKVIHLGDVVINKKSLPILHRLNGEKKLIMGNHDNADMSVYAEYFYDVKAYREFDSCVMSHVPIHTSSLERWSANIHGHLHSNFVMHADQYGNIVRNHRYFNVSVDCDDMNFFPKSWDDIKKTLRDRGVVLQSKRSNRVFN